MNLKTLLGSEDFISMIKSQYSQQGRYYHNINHLEKGLEEISKAENLIINPEEVKIAFLFHDFVYNPKSKDNEERSADSARESLQRYGIPEKNIENITRLILATKHNYIPQRQDEKVITDVDLSALGSPEEEFEIYGDNIRKEYAFVSDEDFKKGRIKILEFFLARDRIYNTDYFAQKYEKSARKNLKNSLRKLKHAKAN